MISLVLMLPIAFASAINPEFIGGNADLPNILETSDNLEIRAAVDADFIVTTDNFLVNMFSTTQPATECTQITSTEYYCTFTSPLVENAAGMYSGTIKLIDDQSVIATQTPFTVTVDGLPPEIESSTIPEYFTNEINLEYEVEEKACPTCTACSGLKEMELTLDGDVVYTKPLEEGGCTLEETTIIATSSLSGIEDGDYEACLVFRDHVDLSSEICRPVTVDLSSPTLAEENVELLNAFGTALTHVRGSPEQARVVATIADLGSGINTNSVKADLSSLNENIGAAYAEFPATCADADEGTYRCTWQIMLDVPFTEEDELIKYAPVTISVKDFAENAYDFTVTFGLRQDTQAPIVNEITTMIPGFLSKQNNTLVVEINEPQSDAGMENKQVFLDMNTFGLGVRQVDVCEQTGSTWECTIDEFAVPESVNSGRTGQISVNKVEDDVGKTYNVQESVTQRSFQYDGAAPEVKNITIIPLGRDLEVIQQGDVVQITAFIEESVSGLDPTYVMVDYGEINEGEAPTSASVCVEIEENLYECTWEYMGQLNPGTIRVSVMAEDIAGNKKDSKTYGVYGTAVVVQTQEYETDYWAENTNLGFLPELNPNFLYFSDAGTLVKLDVELQRSQGSSYVHQFMIDGCIASYDLPKVTNGIVEDGPEDEPVTGGLEENALYEANVETQYYYPTAGRENKLALVRVPPFLAGMRLPNSTTGDVTEDGTIEITCQGQVTQSRTEFSAIFTPNEVVNITATVPLMAGLYTEPGIATIDKIQRGQDFMDGLDKYVLSWMKIWAEWGGKICGVINTIRTTTDALGAIVSAIDVVLNKTPAKSLTEAARKTFSGISTMGKKIWWGGKNGNGCKDSGSAFCPNKYAMLSLGFICDTVLCEQCGTQWGEIMGKIGISDQSLGLNKLLGLAFSGSRVPGEKLGGQDSEIEIPESTAGGGEESPRSGNEIQGEVGGSGVQAVFSPYDNIVVALICWPPCITGIYSQLNVYKQIHIHYNSCLNIAAVRGEDLNQCEQFLAAQVCQQIVGGFFWNWFDRLMKAFIAKLIVGSLEKFFASLAQCPSANDEQGKIMPSCHIFRSVEAGTIAVVKVVNAVKAWESQIGQFNEWFNKSNEETEDETTERIDASADEYIENQVGTGPYE